MLIMDNKELLNKQFEHLNISIYGTYENPLFKGKDIADLLDMKKIRKTIESMDDECKVLMAAPSGGGLQDQWFLTEDGVYEVLFISKKPIAKKFKKWVRTLIKDIRQNSNKELREQLQQQQKLLEYYKEKVYEPIALDETVYVMSTDKDNVYKIGETGSNAKKRKTQMQTNCVEDINILFEFKTCNSKVLENIVHNILEKYRYSGREHFLCNLDYIKMIINIVGKVFNTCKSTSQSISQKEIFEKIEMNVGIQEIVQKEKHDPIKEINESIKEMSYSINQIRSSKKNKKKKYVQNYYDIASELFPEDVQDDKDDFIIKELETRKFLIEELN